MKNLESLSETKQLQYKFWQAFCDYAFKRDDMEKEFNAGDVVHKEKPIHNIGIH